MKSNVIEGHLTHFNDMPNIEESPEMEAERDELCGLSQRDIHDFEESFAKKLGIHKRKQNWKTTYRTR